MLDFCLGTGNAVQPLCVKTPVIHLVDALGDNDGDETLGGLQVLVEVHTKRVHLTCQTLQCVCVCVCVCVVCVCVCVVCVCVVCRVCV